MLYSPKPMHIPDGFLSVPVSIVMFLIAIVVVAYALKRVGETWTSGRCRSWACWRPASLPARCSTSPLPAALPATCWARLWPTILLGPWAAVLVLTCVVGVQALLFQDGGLLALGREHL